MEAASKNTGHGSRSPALFSLLAGAGALPFIACAALSVAGYDRLPVIGSVTHAAATYGVVIACFMAGTHWGTYLYNADAAPTNLFFSSNAVAIFAWVCLLLAGDRATLLALVLTFCFLLAIDSGLYQRHLISNAYFKTRCAVTAVVIASLVGTLAA